jgi:hypothetical protein
MTSGALLVPCVATPCQVAEKFRLWVGAGFAAAAEGAPDRRATPNIRREIPRAIQTFGSRRGFDGMFDP